MIFPDLRRALALKFSPAFGRSEDSSLSQVYAARRRPAPKKECHRALLPLTPLLCSANYVLIHLHDLVSHHADHL